LHRLACHEERLNGLFSAAPVAADGKVSLVSQTGEVIVLRASRRSIPRNDIDERLMASPACAERRAR
jgi:hypothetical protein